MLAAVDQMQIEAGVEPHCERGAFRGMAAVLSSVDEPQGHRHFAQAFPQRLRFGLCVLLLAAARAGAFEESPKILSRAHAVARLQRGRRDQGPVEEVLLEEPARFLERGFHGPAFFALRGIRLWYLAQTGRYVPTGLAAFAVVARAWDVAFEVLWLGIVQLAPFRRGHRP